MSAHRHACCVALGWAGQVIVFVSTCKQAKFMHELFRRIRPGVPVSALHGRIKQTKRMFVYYDFVSGNILTIPVSCSAFCLVVDATAPPSVLRS